MDLREIVDVESSGETPEKRGKGIVPTSWEGGGDKGSGRKVDSSIALQSWLDRIPITSIPNILSPSPVLEITSDDCLLQAISLLHRSNLIGAPIVDNNSDFKKVAEHEIGFIELSGMILWSLEELDRVRAESKGNDHGYLSALKQNPQVGQTKIGELTHHCLWEPFLPIHLDDTLFHVMLLFSKHHRLNIIAVVGSSNCVVVGFIIQHAVLQLLLQSAGLDWFDQIADKALSEFRFENASGVVLVYSDQPVREALHTLWEKNLYGVPVVDRKTGALIGCLRHSDVYLLLEDDILFNKRKILSVKEFMEAPTAICHQNINPSADKLLSASSLSLKNGLKMQMNMPVTNKKTDSLRQVMENLVSSWSQCSSLVNENRQVEGIVTLRDIISLFSPPTMDSRIDGGGFFNSVLRQAGCHVEDGTVIRT